MQFISRKSKLNPRAFSIVFLTLFTLLQVLIIAVAFMGGFLFHELRYADPIFAKAEFPLLNESIKLLRDNAYLPLPENKILEYGMIRGMLQAYDEPHTVFVEPPQHELQTQQLQGRFGGIGVRIERDSENLVYLYPLPDSTALQAGVRDGDRLLFVDELPITPQTTNDELQAAIRGPVGEKVKITVGHSPDFSPVDLVIERAEVALPSVTWNLMPDEPRVGVIQIRIIADTTPAEVTHAIEELQEQGASRFVLDVRNNGGGLVEAGVNTARLFLGEGTIIEQQYRGQPVKTYSADTTGTFADLPIIILVNRGTASAAEIFAGALQGQDRALVVGTRTFGKDTIQLVFSLSDGSSLHVTSAQWWVPGLEVKIGANGIQPDVQVAEEADVNQALIRAVDTILEMDTAHE
jgi:carboxyl-terminal processing protease